MLEVPMTPKTGLLKGRVQIGGMLGSAIGTVASALGAVPAAAQQQQPYYYGPHMWDGAWWMFFGPFAMLLFIAAIIALVVLVVRWLAGTSQGGLAQTPTKTPLDILQERFARGEIDKEEFEERRRILGA